MFSWFSTLFSGGSSILATIAIYVLVFSAGSASGAFVMHKMDNGTYETLVAAQQHSLVMATQKAEDIQKATDKIAMDAAVAEATAQQKIIVQHDYTTQEITRYVPTRTACLSYGVVRLFIHAGLGTSSYDLSNTAKYPDGACASLDASAFVTAVINNYYNYLANAEQLNALESWVAATLEATK